MQNRLSSHVCPLYEAQRLPFRPPCASFASPFRACLDALFAALSFSHKHIWPAVQDELRALPEGAACRRFPGPCSHHTLGELIRLRIWSGTGHHSSSPLTLGRPRLPRHLHGTACCVQQVQVQLQVHAGLLSIDLPRGLCSAVPKHPYRPHRLGLAPAPHLASRAALEQAASSSRRRTAASRAVSLSTGLQARAYVTSGSG